MTRVILLTFGFMCWAWYEMSGGAAYMPGPNGVSIIAKAEAPVVEEAPFPVIEQVAVTRSDMSAEPLTRVTAPRIVVKPAPRIVSVSDDKLQDVAGLVVAMDAADAPDMVQLGGLSGDLSNFGRPVGAGSDKPAIVETVADAVDYRTVSGSRVNLRAGPGTDYGVVTKLVRGNEVEILQDGGDGWVKLRALDGNNIGWMSDSFLVAAN